MQFSTPAAGVLANSIDQNVDGLESDISLIRKGLTDWDLNTGGYVTVGATSTALTGSADNNHEAYIQPRGGDIYVNLGGTATNQDILVEDGQVLVTQFSGAISAIRAGGSNVPTVIRVVRRKS